MEAFGKMARSKRVGGVVQDIPKSEHSKNFHI
jgi:hypothetical protein